MSSQISSEAEQTPRADELELRQQEAWEQRQRASRLFSGADWDGYEADDELDD